LQDLNQILHELDYYYAVTLGMAFDSDLRRAALLAGEQTPTGAGTVGSTQVDSVQLGTVRKPPV